MRTHGLASTYRDGCRCADCRRAAALKIRNSQRYQDSLKHSGDGRGRPRKYA